MTSNDSWQQQLQAALDSSDTTLEQPTQLVVSALEDLFEQRALLLKEQHRLRHAVDLVKHLIRISPTSTRGFALLGYLFCEKLEFENAIDAYQSGLELGQDASLVARLERAKRQQDAKVDFVTRMPADIIIHIFSFIPRHRVLCSTVSKAWKDVLLQLPLWSTLSINTVGLDENGPWRRGIIPYLRPELSSLTVHTSHGVPLLASLLIEAGCEDVHKLRMHPVAF